jgi:chromosome segregation ATPase
MWISSVSIQTDLPPPSCKECDNLIISLTKKSDELDSVFKEVDTITFRHKDNLSQLKRLEEELDFKNKSLESMNNELETTKTKLGTVSDEMIELKEELVNATSKGTEGPATGNESLTLKRLRKIHADLEKEKKRWKKFTLKNLELLRRLRWIWKKN